MSEPTTPKPLTPAEVEYWRDYFDSLRAERAKGETERESYAVRNNGDAGSLSFEAALKIERQLHEDCVAVVGHSLGCPYYDTPVSQEPSDEG